MATLECPARSQAILGCMPALSRCVMWVCLRPCRVTGGRSVLSTSLLNTRDILRGPQKVPLVQGQTSSISVYALPRLSRSVVCSTRCCRRPAVVVSGSVIERAPRAVFGGFSVRPFLVCSSECSTRSRDASKSISDHLSPSISPRRKPAVPASKTGM